MTKEYIEEGLGLINSFMKEYNPRVHENVDSYLGGSFILDVLATIASLKGILVVIESSFSDRHIRYKVITNELSDEEGMYGVTTCNMTVYVNEPISKLLMYNASFDIACKFIKHMNQFIENSSKYKGLEDLKITTEHSQNAKTSE